MSDPTHTTAITEDVALDGSSPPLSATRPLRTGELIADVLTHVYRSQTQDGSPPYMVLALADGNTAVGVDYHNVAQRGTRCRFYGRWDDHPTHGRRFAFSTVVRDLPHDRAGVIRYLTDLCTGVGGQRASDLWDAYGSEAVRTLRESPDVVVAAGVLPEAVARTASAQLETLRALEATRIDLWSIFDGRGFPRVIIDGCLQAWGIRGPAIIRQNAYRLMTRRLIGAGWTRCDRMYLDFGGRRDSLKRLLLCGWHEISAGKAGREGNTWHLADDVVKEVRDSVPGVDTARIWRALMLGVRSRWLARRESGGQTWIADGHKASNEAALARRARAMLGEEWALHWDAQRMARLAQEYRDGWRNNE